MRTCLFVCLMMLSMTATAETLDSLLKRYDPKGGSAFNVERGKQLWNKQFLPGEDKVVRSCTVCHGKDLTKSGKHAKTGKVIAPMARSVNPERFTDYKKVEKWFTRNCKWTLDRECTPQEKGDLLKYLAQF